MHCTRFKLVAGMWDCVVAESWRPTTASPEYIHRLRSLWRVALGVSRADPSPPVAIPPLTGAHESAPTPYTTGLGLPLSRALAKAGNGWLVRAVRVWGCTVLCVLGGCVGDCTCWEGAWGRGGGAD